MTDHDASGDVVNVGADNSDSDDYDPSAMLGDDYSAPSGTSQMQSTAMNLAAIPPASASSFTAPAETRPSENDATTMPAEAGFIRPDPTQVPSNVPRLKGGFVIDDDDDDDDDNGDVNEEDEGKDILDVYDTPEESKAEIVDLAPVSEGPIDSSSVSHAPIHDAAQISVKPVPVSNGASGVTVSSSTSLPASNVTAQRGSTVTPIQTSSNPQASVVPPSNSVISTPVSAAPRSRLAHDTIGILEDRIKDDPRGDMAAWLELIEELKGRNKKEDVRRTYERFFKTFPMAAEQWIAYANYENDNNQLFFMEQIFGKSLLTVPDVNLWSLYVNYIRRRNSMSTGDVAKSYKIISEAFNFALNNVGMDKDAGKLWQDYVDFVKSGPGIVGGTGWQDTQKMDALRAAYQRAIAVPTSALNVLWKEYDNFETGLSKINGRKFLQERSPAYMTARSCYIQLQNMTKDLERTTLPKLPPAPGFDGDVEYVRQVGIWRHWIQWEKDDNVVLKDEDVKAYRERVIFVYKQALMALQFWPEIWYEAAEFCFSCGMNKEALEFLTQGISANPESCLLAFKLADHIELTTINDEGSDPGAKARMQKVREPYNQVLNALYELVTKVRNRETQDIRKIESTISSGQTESRLNRGPEEEELDNEGPDAENNKHAAQVQIDAIKKGADAQALVLQKTLSFVWVALMRVCRRIQGKGMPGERAGGFRTILQEARKRGKITSDVYIQSALIEYHCYKDNTATKIFERGIKLFPDDEVFALEYIKHLIAINDVTNARAVFETTVGRLTSNVATAAKAKMIFAYMHEYESHFGDLSQVSRLEHRMREFYPDDLGVRQFSLRFVTSTFDPTSVRPIISSQQTRPRTVFHPSIEASTSAVNSPQVKTLDITAANSPKRPFPGDDFEDSQPRKLLRGESPLKGAAGRRMDQQKRQNLNGYPTSSLSQAHPAPPAPLPAQINFLLSIIPKASSYTDTRFDASKMVELIREVHLRPPGSIRPLEAQPPSWQPTYAPHQQAPGGLPAFASTQAIGQAQYGAPFRYT